MRKAKPNLLHVEEIEPINDSDLECLEEIRKTLAKHDRLDRFGVALLHTHFEVNEDELLVETCDESARVLTTSIAKRENCDERTLMGTIWSLGSGEAMMWCRQYCQRYGFGSHSRAHDRV